MQLHQRAATAYLMQITGADRPDEVDITLQSPAGITNTSTNVTDPSDLSLQHPSTRPEGGHTDECPTGSELARTVSVSTPLLSPPDAVRVALAHYRCVQGEAPFLSAPCSNACVAQCAPVVEAKLLALLNSRSIPATDAGLIRRLLSSLGSYPVLLPLLQAMCVEETLHRASETRRLQQVKQQEERVATQEQAIADASGSEPCPLPMSLNTLEQAALTEADGNSMSAALQAVRASDALLVAARLARLRAKLSGGADGTEPELATAEAISQLETLYRRLLDESLAVRDSVAWSRTQADDDMQRRLQRGKTTRAQRAIALALGNEELLQVFRMEEQDRQQQEMQRRMEAKRKQRQQREADDLQRRKETELECLPPIPPLMLLPPEVKVPLLLNSDVVRQRLGNVPLTLLAPISGGHLATRLSPLSRSPISPRSGAASPAHSSRVELVAGAVSPARSPHARAGSAQFSLPSYSRRIRGVELGKASDAALDSGGSAESVELSPLTATTAGSSPARSLQAQLARPMTAAAASGHSRARSMFDQALPPVTQTFLAAVDAASEATAAVEDAWSSSAAVNRRRSAWSTGSSVSAGGSTLAAPAVAAPPRLLTPPLPTRLPVLRPSTASPAAGARSRRSASVSPSPGSLQLSLSALAATASATAAGDTDAIGKPAAAPLVSQMTPAQLQAAEARSAQLAGAYFARQAAAAQIKLDRLKQLREDTHPQQ